MPLKLLLLTHRVPFPLNDGGAMGVHYFVDGYLKQGVDIALLSMNTTKHFVAKENMPALFTNLRIFKTIEVDNAIKIGAALKNIFSSKSYNTQRFESVAFENALVEILQKNTFDIVQIDNIYLESYIPVIRKFSRAKLVCRIHNIEHLIWQRLADNKGKSIKKWYLNLLAKRLKRVELKALQNVDAWLSINKKEEQTLGDLGIKTNCYYMPFGIDIQSIAKKNIQLQDQTIFHLGSLDWQPNLEGVAWFINEVWPLIEQKNGAVQLHIAGKNMPKYLLENKMHNVIIHGNVPDATAFMQTYHTLIVPLLSGAGVRIKILEALSLGKHIVSTSLGADGIDVTHQKNILLADTPQDFSNAILQIMEGQHLQLGQEAQKLAMLAYNKTDLFFNLKKYLENFAKA
jgi:polysaccharide biosynthesis protein PslH